MDNRTLAAVRSSYRSLLDKAGTAQHPSGAKPVASPAASASPDDVARRASNASRLQQMDPSVRDKMQAVLGDLEGQGYKPYVSESWRSKAQQHLDHLRGASTVDYGFHNVTGSKGEKQAMAMDVYNHGGAGQSSPNEFYMKLASAAKAHGLMTGIEWGLPQSNRKAIDTAIASHNYTAPIQRGWDPGHVQPSNISIGQASRGVKPFPGRPAAKAAAPTRALGTQSGLPDAVSMGGVRLPMFFDPATAPNPGPLNRWR